MARPLKPKKRNLPAKPEKKKMAVMRKPWGFPFPFEVPKPGETPFPEEEE